MSTVEHANWAEAWRKRNELRKEPGNQEYWDSRSKDFSAHSGVSRYTDIFLTYLDLEPGWSVLDMGSGPGTLAIPLAEAGHQVISADFSAGMREEALKRAQAKGLRNFEVKDLDWNSDWQEAGVAPKSVDVALASRSTMVDDLAQALHKMDRTARHKVALTMTTEYTPRGYKPRGSTQDNIEDYVADYIYGLNILFELGAYPELRYIDTHHGNGGEREDELVRWAFISWTPVTQA